MKKFLSIVSLMLALLMVVGMTSVAAEEADAAPAEDAAEETTETAAWVAPVGIKTYYAENVEGKTPVLDGTISEGEYGKAYRLDKPIPVNNYGSNHQEEPVADPTAVSEYVDVYFAYDENNFYIAIYEMGPKSIEIVEGVTDRLVPARANWIFNMGFDLNDLQSYFQMQGYATNKQWADTEFSYFEFGKKNSSPIKAYDLISEAVIQKTNIETGDPVAIGDLLSSNGNANYTEGQCSLAIELKFDRSVVAQAMNECYFTDYDTTSNAMYFGLGTNQYGRKTDAPGQYYKWMGQTDIRGIQGQYADFGIYEGSTREFIFDLIVFGDENTVIEIADPFPVRPETTEPEETDPVVEETTPVETTPVESEAEESKSDESKADDTTEAGGCGSAVSLAGIALVAALGTCTAFVAKKKED